MSETIHEKPNMWYVYSVFDCGYWGQKVSKYTIRFALYFLNLIVLIKSYYSVKKNVEVWTFPQRFKQRALCQLESNNGIDHAVLSQKKN